MKNSQKRIIAFVNAKPSRFRDSRKQPIGKQNMLPIVHQTGFKAFVAGAAMLGAINAVLQSFSFLS